MLCSMILRYECRTLQMATICTIFNITFRFYITTPCKKQYFVNIIISWVNNDMKYCSNIRVFTYCEYWCSNGKDYFAHVNSAKVKAM